MKTAYKKKNKLMKSKVLMKLNAVSSSFKHYLSQFHDLSRDGHLIP